MSKFAETILRASVNGVALNSQNLATLGDIEDIDKELADIQQEIEQLLGILAANPGAFADRASLLLKKCDFWMLTLREGANVLAAISTENSKGQTQ